jgi:hypothetical protein
MTKMEMYFSLQILWLFFLNSVWCQPGKYWPNYMGTDLTFFISEIAQNTMGQKVYTFLCVIGNDKKNCVFTLFICLNLFKNYFYSHTLIVQSEEFYCDVSLLAEYSPHHPFLFHLSLVSLYMHSWYGTLICTWFC